MCGRFAAGHLTQGQMQQIVEGFLDGSVGVGPVRVDARAPAPRGGYHVRPTHPVALVARDRAGAVVTSSLWQIAPPGGRPLINARIENDRFWRRALDHGRCLIPALGYFEWVQEPGARLPHFITVSRNAPVIFFAGLLSEDRTGVVIVTRPPSPQIAHLHSRMPVIVSAGEMGPWLSGGMDIATAQRDLGTLWEGRFAWHRVAPLGRDTEGAQVIAPYERPQSSFDFQGG